MPVFVLVHCGVPGIRHVMAVTRNSRGGMNPSICTCVRMNTVLWCAIPAPESEQVYITSLFVLLKDSDASSSSTSQAVIHRFCCPCHDISQLEDSWLAQLCQHPLSPREVLHSPATHMASL